MTSHMFAESYIFPFMIISEKGTNLLLGLNFSAYAIPLKVHHDIAMFEYCLRFTNYTSCFFRKWDKSICLHKALKLSF